MTEAEATQSALQNAHSASQYAIQAAECAKRAAQAAEIAEAAAALAQGNAEKIRRPLCLVQVRIGKKRLRYSQHYASESEAAQCAHRQFCPHAKEGENISITAHAAPQKGEEP